VVLRCEIPDHSAYGRQQQDKTHDTPNHSAASRPVADEFFMRPVLCVGDILADAISARRPSRPPEERSHFVLLSWGAQGARRDRVGVASVAVDVGVVRCQFVKGRGTIVVEQDRIGGRIISIVARDCREAALQRRLLFRGKGSVAG
jgi:hypothetical protein